MILEFTAIARSIISQCRIMTRISLNSIYDRYGDALKSLEKAKKMETTTFFYVNQMNNQECEAYTALGKVQEGIAVC